MYIEPNTNIGFISNCPLDPTYNHTIYWIAEGAQRTYFLSQIHYLAQRQSYQRVNKGVIRVGITADRLYDCNYLMFQNTAYGDKWFYAFIVSVEYLNNGACEVRYELDVMQTWYFDYQLRHCYVDREHSRQDNVGENTVPENLELGDYYVDASGDVSNPHAAPADFGMIAVTTFDQSKAGFPDFQGTDVNGFYTSLDYQYYSSPTQLNFMLETATDLDKIGGVIAIYMAPFDNDPTYAMTIDNVSVPKVYGNFQGYSPKNAKLYTYPYNLLHVYTDQATADFRYEYFNQSSCTFLLYQSAVPEPTQVLVPNAYQKGSWEYRLTNTLFPQCPFGSDVYKQWLAANANSNAVRMLGIGWQEAKSAFSGAIGAAQVAASAFGYGDVGSGLRSAIGGLSGIVDSELQVKAINAQQQDMATKPPQMNGTQSSGIDYAIGTKKFKWKCLKIRAEYCRIIDDYFNMYGYATRRVKVPNTNVRPHWTYTKTVGCVVTGSVPADDITKICKIYDAGITFWKDPAEIGDYSLDNRPGGVG